LALSDSTFGLNMSGAKHTALESKPNRKISEIEQHQTAKAFSYLHCSTPV